MDIPFNETDSEQEISGAAKRPALPITKWILEYMMHRLLIPRADIVEKLGCHDSLISHALAGKTSWGTERLWLLSELARIDLPNLMAYAISNASPDVWSAVLQSSSGAVIADVLQRRAQIHREEQHYQLILQRITRQIDKLVEGSSGRDRSHFKRMLMAAEEAPTSLRSLGELLDSLFSFVQPWKVSTATHSNRNSLQRWRDASQDSTTGGRTRRKSARRLAKSSIATIPRGSDEQYYLRVLTRWRKVLESEQSAAEGDSEWLRLNMGIRHCRLAKSSLGGAAGLLEWLLPDAARTTKRRRPA